MYNCFVNVSLNMSLLQFRVDPLNVISFTNGRVNILHEYGFRLNAAVNITTGAQS